MLKASLLERKGKAKYSGDGLPQIHYRLPELCDRIILCFQLHKITLTRVAGNILDISCLPSH